MAPPVFVFRARACRLGPPAETGIPGKRTRGIVKRTKPCLIAGARVQGRGKWRKGAITDIGNQRATFKRSLFPHPLAKKGLRHHFAASTRFFPSGQRPATCAPKRFGHPAAASLPTPESAARGARVMVVAHHVATKGTARTSGVAIRLFPARGRSSRMCVSSALVASSPTRPTLSAT